MFLLSLNLIPSAGVAAGVWISLVLVLSVLFFAVMGVYDVSCPTFLTGTPQVKLC